MRRDSSFCAKSVRDNNFTNGAPFTRESAAKISIILKFLQTSSIGLHYVKTYNDAVVP